MSCHSWCDVFWKPSKFQNFWFLETSWAYFPGWGQKYLKTVLWRSPGLIFRAGARNALKLSSEGILGTLSGLGPEMLQNCPLDVFWALSGLSSTNPYVRQTHVQETLCSINSMFNKPYVQHTRVQRNYVERTLCSTNPMFNKPYVQQTLCSRNLGSTNPMFNTRGFGYWSFECSPP